LPEEGKKDAKTLLAIRDAVEKGPAAMLPGAGTAALTALLAEVDVIETMPLEERDKADKAKLDAEAVKWRAELAVRSLGPGGVWEIKSADLQKCIERAVNCGKTPLVIDNTSGELADTFIKYSSHIGIDAKGLVARKAMGVADVSELQDELRKELVRSVTMGFPLHIKMGSSAAGFKPIFCHPDKFPIEVFTTKQFRGFDGKGDVDYFTSAINCPEFLQRLVKPGSAEDVELQKSVSIGRQTKMYVVVTSRFELEDYEEFLAYALPDNMKDIFQTIHIVDDR